MKRRRKQNGFRQVGEVDPGRRDLPAARARELKLARSWARLAGDALARVARPLKAARGVLDVGLVGEDSSWDATVAELLPRLAGRVAHEHRELGIRKVRLRDADGNERLPPTPIVPPEEAATGSAAPPPAATERHERPVPRLDELMETYLDRTAEKRDQKP
ncbi:MAG: DUF721 domain-containing protein [bacterium]|nr:DUF721 domain-containing protein [bacterium]